MVYNLYSYEISKQAQEWICTAKARWVLSPAQEGDPPGAYLRRAEDPGQPDRCWKQGLPRLGRTRDHWSGI